MMAFMAISSAVAADGIKVGDKAPDFQMKGSDGKTYSAKDFVDKQAVVIAWFPRAFTNGCTKECKSIKDSGAKLNEYIGKDGKILAVDDMVKTETHGQELSEQLEKLGVAKKASEASKK